MTKHVNTRTIATAFLLTAFCTEGAAQRNKEYILRNTNVEELNRLSDLWATEYAAKHAEALRIARERGWPTEGLQYIDERGLPVYYARHNNSAAIMTQTTGLRSSHGVQGQGMLIGEWDGGHARTTHQDLSGRVTIGDAPYNIDSHATHVGGTLIGSPPAGVSTSSRGMAPQAQLKSYDWTNDISEMTSAAAAGLLISNHSYGPLAGWKQDDGTSCSGFAKKYTWYGGEGEFNANGDDPRFGRYGQECRSLDVLCSNAPHYLPLVAAGNDHTDEPDHCPTLLCCDDVVRYVTSYDADGPNGWSAYIDYDPDAHPVGDGDQTSCIGGMANAKNNLTVANLQGDQTVNESSSRGRTDDGRIKPDICGKGTDIYSAESASNTAYGTKTGTSMASPNVAGSLLLLQELYENLHGNAGTYMRSASLKGLAIHHALDLGFPGPDFTYGWGLLQAEYMGNMLAHDVGAGNGTQTMRIIEVPGTLGHVYSFNTTGALRVTLCYTDVAGTATTTHNDPAIKLVNDLDLRIIGPGGTVYQPYVMNAIGLAMYGDNDVDNVEQVYRTGLPAGTYQVHVNAEGGLTGTQYYTLLISGQNNACNYSVSHGPVALNSTTYNAQHDISSMGDVSPSGTVTYNAGSSISLKPGFSAPAGSNFLARIQSCN